MAVTAAQTNTLEQRAAALLEAGKPAQAGRFIRQLPRQSSELLRLLAVSHSNLGDDKEAARVLRLAVRRSHASPLAHADWGVLLARRGMWHAAERAFARALELNPSDNSSLLYRAFAQSRLARPLDAIQLLRAVLASDPANRDALESLISAAKDAGDMEAIIPDLDRALAAAPRDIEIRQWLAEAHSQHGRYELAFDVIRRGRYLPLAQVESFRLHRRLGDPQESAASQLRAYTGWIRRHTQPFPPERSHRARLKRKLRIGYLSGEFTAIPAFYFVMPLLQFHSPDRVQVFAYHSRPREDARTQEFRRYCHRFHNVSAWPEARIAAQIRRDEIDVLVDLSGHFDDHRLGVFRRRPAPISFAYPNYPATTGVLEIDYIFTDPWVDPPGSARKYVEQPWRLPSGYLAYRPSRYSPPVVPPPVLRNGFITFGMLQQAHKLHSGVWDALAQCLREVPRSQLILQYASDDLYNPQSAACRRLGAEFSRRGVSPGRVRFAGAMTHRQHMKLREEIDIGLDTFPYNGQTTTCESLWMGVPSVSLMGETHVSRVGYSLLARTGLADWVASSWAGYIELAARHSRDIPRLVELRSTLRQNVRAGLNQRRLAREVEDAYLSAAHKHLGFEFL